MREKALSERTGAKLDVAPSVVAVFPLNVPVNTSSAYLPAQSDNTGFNRDVQVFTMCRCKTHAYAHTYKKELLINGIEVFSWLVLR